jgi:hypothetical protein
VSSPSVSIPGSALLIVGAGLVAAVYVWRKGGVAQAATAVGAGLVNAAGGVASGAVGAVGASVGLPTPDQTTTDPKVARYVIDQAGYLEASKWASATALFSAMTMPANSGTPPPAGTALAARMATFQMVPLTTGDFTRTDHDTSAPVGTYNAQPLPGFSANDPAAYGIGL